MQRKLLLSAGMLSTFYLLSEKRINCCGIIGILSEKRDNIADSLSLGVQLLKNRGYDSAGVVTFSQKQGVVHQQMIKKAEQKNEKANCIDRLVQQVTNKIIKSHIGIGHTRWATCGQKVQRNAHPHFDQSKNIYLVHNGIIGGHASIKNDHLSQTKFNSETDSEVAVQLIGKFINEGKTMLQAIHHTEQVIKKSSANPQWGMVIINKKQPHKMWTTTNGSPILIGMNDKEIYVASQIIAFQKQADCYFATGDGQVYQLQVQVIPALKQKMQKQGRLKFISNKDKSNVSTFAPQPYKSWYSYQIHQQGQIKFTPQFDRVKALQFEKFLTMIACGSSMYAALTALYYFKKLNAFTKINIYDPSQMVEGDIIKGQSVVLISQSGQTKDLINIVEKCKKIQDVKTIGIINVQGSTLARMVDFPIYIKVGREASVAATKSMFHQTLNLIMLAVQVATKKQSADQQVLQQMSKQLLQIPNLINDLILGSQKICKDLAQILHKKKSIYLLAMRECMAIAKQAALKIKQLNYIHAEALGACQMKHGPIALIQSDKPKQTPVILFILDNQTFEPCTNAYDQMNSRNALVIIITDCKQKILKHYETKKKKQINKNQIQEPLQLQQEIEKKFNFITVPKLKYFSNLLCLIPLQILVQKISILKQINPDMPRNLAKTVTV